MTRDDAKRSGAVMSHKRWPSSPAVTSQRPSGLNPRDHTVARWAERVLDLANGLFPVRSHRCTVPSQKDPTSQRPSGLNVTFWALELCRIKTVDDAPGSSDVVSQSR